MELFEVLVIVVNAVNFLGLNCNRKLYLVGIVVNKVLMGGGFHTSEFFFRFVPFRVPRSCPLALSLCVCLLKILEERVFWKGIEEKMGQPRRDRVVSWNAEPNERTHNIQHAYTETSI
jgi:hypothetical protein